MKHIFFVCTILVLFSCKNTTPVHADLQGYESSSISGTEATRVIKKDADGNIIEVGYVQNGAKTGAWTTYYPTGKLKSVVGYINGRKNGVDIQLSDRGRVALESSYINDQLDGKYARYDYGTLKEEKTYANGKLNGPMKVFGSNNKIQKLITYKDGKQDGKLQYFDDAGNVTLEYLYKNGEKVSGGIVKKAE